MHISIESQIYFNCDSNAHIYIDVVIPIAQGSKQSKDNEDDRSVVAQFRQGFA